MLRSLSLELLSNFVGMFWLKNPLVFHNEKYIRFQESVKRCYNLNYLGKQGSRKIFPKMKVHTIKYLKIAMICSVINFLVNNPVNKTVILLPQAAIFVS